MQGIGAIRKSLHGHPQANRVSLCPEENKKRVSQIHDGPVHTGSENSNVLQSSKTRQSLRIFRRQGAFLHASGVYGRGVFILTHEEKQEVLRKRSSLKAILDLRRNQGNA